MERSEILKDCANHSQILGDKAGTYREMEGKCKVVVTIGDVSQLKIMLIIIRTYKSNFYPP